MSKSIPPTTIEKPEPCDEKGEEALSPDAGTGS